MRQYLMEFIGTFFLVLTVALVAIMSPLPGPIAIGAILMVMVYAGGSISGGHYNPAVSLGVWLRGGLSKENLIAYLAAQALGGVAGVLVAPLTLPGQIVSIIPHAAVVPTLLAELLFTFALVFTVLNVATVKSSAGNSYFGLAIGFLVAAGAVVVGPISGGVFNPAVALGLSVLGATPWHEFPLFVIAQLIGGALAAFTFRFLRPSE